MSFKPLLTTTVRQRHKQTSSGTEEVSVAESRSHAQPLCPVSIYEAPFPRSLVSASFYWGERGGGRRRARFSVFFFFLAFCLLINISLVWNPFRPAPLLLPLLLSFFYCFLLVSISCINGFVFVWDTVVSLWGGGVVFRVCFLCCLFVCLFLEVRLVFFRLCEHLRSVKVKKINTKGVNQHSKEVPLPFISPKS